jgi:uncharacterized membrane protein
LLLPFAVGAVGSLLGAAVAALLLHSAFGAKHCAGLAAVFAATYVGGSLNYVAVGTALALPDHLLAAGLAADLSLMILYFGLLFWRGRVENIRSGNPESVGTGDDRSARSSAKQDREHEGTTSTSAHASASPASHSKRSKIVTALQSLFPLALALALQYSFQTVCSRYAALSKCSAACEVLLVSFASMALARLPQLRPSLRSAGPPYCALRSSVFASTRSLWCS